MNNNDEEEKKLLEIEARFWYHRHRFYDARFEREEEQLLTEYIQDLSCLLTLVKEQRKKLDQQ